MSASLNFNPIRDARASIASTRIISHCTDDGVWFARDVLTGVFASGSTQAEAEAEVRRLSRMPA